MINILPYYYSIFTLYNQTKANRYTLLCILHINLHSTNILLINITREKNTVTIVKDSEKQNSEWIVNPSI